MFHHVTGMKTAIGTSLWIVRTGRIGVFTDDDFRIISSFGPVPCRNDGFSLNREFQMSHIGGPCQRKTVADDGGVPDDGGRVAVCLKDSFAIGILT